MTKNFLEALEYLLGLEGGHTNHGWDPGGETKYGIARKYWPQYWKDGPPTLETAQRFYWTEFWTPMRLENLNSQPLRVELFEAGVNCGAGTAIKFAQRSYNLLRPETWQELVVDGGIGPKTVMALNTMSTPYLDALLAGCNYFQAEYYIGCNPKVRSKALRGWFAKRLAWDPTQK